MEMVEQHLRMKQILFSFRNIHSRKRKSIEWTMVLTKRKLKTKSSFVVVVVGIVAVVVAAVVAVVVAVVVGVVIV